jgi:hypothetical protein
VTPGRSRRSRGAVLLAVLPCLLALTGCTRAVDGVPTAGPRQSLPASPEQLEALLVTAVPSGLPRLADDELEPPAGAKRVADVAAYADDPARERKVLEDYGYRFGWERFWGTDTAATTGVFVDQFQTRAGAAAYAEDLARNDAAHYDGVLVDDPVDLPGGCRLLSVEEPVRGLPGPAVFAWCGSGVHSVGVTAVADSVDAAEEEVRVVLAEQLDRLPPR